MPQVILPLGPSIVDWNAGEAVFQKTFGGIIFRYEELQQAVRQDQRGLTDVDDVTTGVVNPILEVPMTDEELVKLNLLFANSTSAGNLEVANPVGETVLANARRVLVKPIINGIISTTASQWIVIHKAFPRITLEYNYDNENQRVTTVLFKGYPTQVSGVIDALFRISGPGT